MSITGMSALELGKKIRAREISVLEATEAVLESVRRKEPAVNAFITVDEEGARRRAGKVQKQIDEGALTGPLAGVPVAVKDNLCTKGVLTTCGSKMLSNFVPRYTAAAVENLNRAGAIVFGKTNMDEFAMGSTTETSYFGPAKIPGIQSMFRADLPEGRARRLRRRNARMPWGPIPADRSASPVLFAALWA